MGCLSPLNWDLASCVELAISFNCNVDHCMALVTSLNCEDLSVIMGYDLASLLCNQIDRNEHRLNHPSCYPREHCLRDLIYFDQAQGPRADPCIFAEAERQLG